MTTTIWGLPARELPCAVWLDLFDPVPILQTKPGMIVLSVISTRSNVKAERSISIKEREGSMVGRRLKEIAAMAIIGEGIIGALFPRRHLHLWKFGPKKYRKFIDATARRPNLVRIAAGAGAGLGVLWALRQISR